MFSRVCEATWPTLSPVTSTCFIACVCEFFRDSMHHSAVEHCSVWLVAMFLDRCLHGRKGNDIQSRCRLPLREMPYEFLYFSLGADAGEFR